MFHGSEFQVKPGPKSLLKHVPAYVLQENKTNLTKFRNTFDALENIWHRLYLPYKVSIHVHTVDQREYSK